MNVALTRVVLGIVTLFNSIPLEELCDAPRRLINSRGELNEESECRLASQLAIAVRVVAMVEILALYPPLRNALADYGVILKCIQLLTYREKKTLRVLDYAGHSYIKVDSYSPCLSLSLSHAVGLGNSKAYHYDPPLFGVFKFTTSTDCCGVWSCTIAVGS